MVGFPHWTVSWHAGNDQYYDHSPIDWLHQFSDYSIGYIPLIVGYMSVYIYIYTIVIYRISHYDPIQWSPQLGMAKGPRCPSLAAKRSRMALGHGLWPTNMGMEQDTSSLSSNAFFWRGVVLLHFLAFGWVVYLCYKFMNPVPSKWWFSQ